jgi:hypothetical protein
MGDQLLVNVDQFATLMRLQKPGDDITLQLIRKGQKQTISVTLAEKEVPVLEEIRAMLGGAGPLAWTGPAVGEPAGPGRVIRIDPAGSEHVVFFRDGVSVVLGVDKDGARHLRVIDQGRVVFDGPFTTEEDRARLPERYRDLVENAIESSPVNDPPATQEAPPA